MTGCMRRWDDAGRRRAEVRGRRAWEVVGAVTGGRSVVSALVAYESVRRRMVGGHGTRRGATWDEGSVMGHDAERRATSGVSCEGSCGAAKKLTPQAEPAA